MGYSKVIEHVCSSFGISQEEFMKVSRRRYIVDARFAAMKIYCTEFNISLKRIGELIRPFDPFDHTSVIHGNKEAGFRIKTEFDFKEKFNVALSNIRKDKELEIELPKDLLAQFNNAVESVQSKIEFTSMRYKN